LCSARYAIALDKDQPKLDHWLEGLCPGCRAAAVLVRAHLSLLQKNASEADRKHFSRRAEETPRSKGHVKCELFRGGLLPASVNRLKKQKKFMDKPGEPIHGLPSPSMCLRRRYCSPVTHPRPPLDLAAATGSGHQPSGSTRMSLDPAPTIAPPPRGVSQRPDPLPQLWI
jgi:hypothetical protein